MLMLIMKQPMHSSTEVKFWNVIWIVGHPPITMRPTHVSQCQTKSTINSHLIGCKTLLCSIEKFDNRLQHSESITK